MNTNTNRHGASQFDAFEVALEVVASLRAVVARIRRQEVSLANQIVRSASSVCANVAEGNRRQGKDRLHLIRIAAGSAEETRAHLRVALAWGWIETGDVEPAMQLLDRELAMLWRLTH